jgi:hypothetical protein
MTDTATHTGLYPALLAAQGEIGTLPKDSINPHFKSKYTPLDTIVEHVGPILTRHGLVWVTKPCRDSTDAPALAYRLVHAHSKEAEEGIMPLLLSKSDPQGQGSAITYARRYALTSVLNLVADADDDGEATRAAARGEEPPEKSAAKPAARKPAAKKSEQTIPADAVADLARLYAASGWKDTDADDPHSTLRMQLAAVGAGNEGEIVECIRALTTSQASTVRSALSEARDS